MKKIAILILAAGKSSRMGTPKQLLPYKNLTLLSWSIEQAKKSKVDNIFCVLGANKESILEKTKHQDINIVFNPNYTDGLSSSIVVGINHVAAKNFEAVLIMLADQPNVDSIYLNELIKTSEENNSKVIASNYIQKVGVPAIFPKNYFQELINLKGDKGAKELLNKKDSEIIKMSPFNLIDIDTKEDYKNLIK